MWVVDHKDPKIYYNEVTARQVLDHLVNICDSLDNTYAFNIRLAIPTCWLVGWLILLPPVVGWYTMGCETEPLPSYNDLRKCSYSFTLN